VKKISLTISSSFKELGDRLDTFDKSLSYTMERQDNIDTRLKQVEEQIRSSGDLGNKITSLQEQIDTMEQQARLYNIEIANLPERRDENLTNIIEKIGGIIKHPVSASEVVSVHRVPHFDKKDTRPKNIIVRFTTKILRDNFIQAAKGNKYLKSDQLAVGGTTRNVYINEHLTAKNKQIFRLCRERAAKHQYKYVWIKRGTVLVRQTDSSPIFAVRSELDLKKIK
jgi:Na+/phosphate symporter